MTGSRSVHIDRLRRARATVNAERQTSTRHKFNVVSARRACGTKVNVNDFSFGCRVFDDDGAAARIGSHEHLSRAASRDRGATVGKCAGGDTAHDDGQPTRRACGQAGPVRSVLRNIDEMDSCIDAARAADINVGLQALQIQDRVIAL